MGKSQEKYLNLISAEVIADSLNQFEERIRFIWSKIKKENYYD